MSGLRLGDLILDSRRLAYIPSLRAVVCAGLPEALQVGIAGGLRGVLERVDGALAEYNPEFLVVLGSMNSASPTALGSAFAGMSRRWGKHAKLMFVATTPDPDARATAEALGGEVHHELVWGHYRFVEAEDLGNLEVQLLTISGSPHYAVKVGNRPFGGMKLPVFLKGLGRLTLPSMAPNASLSSVFQPALDRFDIFAVGHQRVLPLGKVRDIKPLKGIARGLPISKATLGARRRAPKAPLAD
ncbi:MAG: hypothetical protein HY074_18615 [Deltaproteobacteria bacterium]|nr:hypothetical protein [Deltaproteobacteria bacterium]